MLTCGLCAEVTCSRPLPRPHTRLQWDGSSGLGSVAQYECVTGFYQQGGASVSTCLQSGLWTDVSVQCKGMLATPPPHTHTHSVAVAAASCQQYDDRNCVFISCQSSGTI